MTCSCGDPSRRDFLSRLGGSFGAVALEALLREQQSYHLNVAAFTCAVALLAEFDAVKQQRQARQLPQRPQQTSQGRQRPSEIQRPSQRRR